ncbi:MAG: diaminopimelate epimerase [Eubacteriales bacterium]
MKLKFTKMQAYGNDYVYIDGITQNLEGVDLGALSLKLSDRHFYIGSDGIVIILSSNVADFRMRMFNPDGTEGEMCGNAIRSLARFVYDHNLTQKTEFQVETLGGIKNLTLYLEEGQVVNIKADIGEPIFDTKKIPIITELPEFISQKVDILDKTFEISAVSWGNPHCVLFVEDVLALDLPKYGPAIEHSTHVFPNRTNVTFAQIVTPNHIKIREWERGTGETIGCGTGCCTAVVVAVRLGMSERAVTVEQIGGDLEVIWDETTGRVQMKGPSHTVFESEIEVAT